MSLGEIDALVPDGECAHERMATNANARWGKPPTLAVCLDCGIAIEMRPANTESAMYGNPEGDSSGVSKTGYVMATWVVFSDGTPSGCIEIERGETFAMALGEMGKVERDVDSYWAIPYPADPRLRRVGDTPSFCHDPAGKCRGRGSCPMPYSCTE